ncbi:glycogen debranching N-terminal domain-containing protein [Microbacterium sp.]|uniref:glycogen debranching N-terminal domain-containing protein n=1 Tax=Microbacterium sp. TaxID=51671 RepID=UPI0039E7249A
MTAARQPLLHDAVIALHAPTQVWSGACGDLGDAPVHGVYHGDVRHIGALRVEVDGAKAEAICHTAAEAAEVRFDGVLRHLDDELPDPLVRLVRTRRVADGEVVEGLEIRSARPVRISGVLTVRIAPDFCVMHEVKAGIAEARPWTLDGDVVRSGEAGFHVEAPDAQVRRQGGEVVVSWPFRVPPRGRASFGVRVRLSDPRLVVAGAASPWPEVATSAADPRLRRWLACASDDLGALRLTLPGETDAFFAAGAPWFLTLFGRDSLWTARLALPLAPAVAASTLRVLARLQGTRVDPVTAEAPGKIPHELRSEPLELPSEAVRLPPLYYGTVDATPLWVCLLADAADAGMPLAEVRGLLSALRAALGWLTGQGASRHGFVDYVDESGRGLANQGWKDSGDSIQWRDGTLAQGPIALCEVQGYAYEAAVRGADLLDRLGETGAAELRDWAASLRERFRAAYWVSTPEGTYPAVALDAEGRPVDTLTSNIGHLIGTGILDPDEELHCAELLLGPGLSSGFGIRTLSTGAAGFWPLGYHRGSVWTHDSAIAVHGMARAGLAEQARRVAEQLVEAAERFGYRVPELHSGDGAGEARSPAPYPASCRPQAWSAAAAVVCAAAYASRDLPFATF